MHVHDREDQDILHHTPLVLYAVALPYEFSSAQCNRMQHAIVLISAWIHDVNSYLSPLPLSLTK